MKLYNVWVLATCITCVLATTSNSTESPSSLSDPTVTVGPKLDKRYQKVRLPKSTTSSSSSEIPSPWIRTIYGSIAEIVTPSVIQGVTFNAKPPKETDAPLPWVSLNKEGSPKTIRPKIKNGITANASPTYSTYFQTATTVVYDYENLKAHNMDPGQTHEEIEFIEEDKTYVSLNPLIRCTPDRYFKLGLARDEESAPFCTPHENKELKMGQIYFITWFTKFFSDDVTNVRLHFTYVKESLKDKGMKKREVTNAFFSSDWIDNIDGFYPFEIKEDWLLDKFIQSVAVSIQPDNVSDEEFNVLDNAIKFKIMKGSKVARKNKETRRIEDEGINNDNVYYIILSIPSVVAVAALGMYFFLYLTRKDRDFSNVTQKAWESKHKVLGKFKPKTKNKYTELPQYNKENSKQS